MPNEALTPEQRAELKRLCEKATPGEWRVLEVMGKKFLAAKPTPEHPYFNRTRNMDVIGDEDYPRRDFDLHLAAAARTALPSLLLEVERLERERDEVWPIVANAVGPKAAAEIFRGMADMAEKLESAESALRAQQWVKVTPETMPPEGVEVEGVDIRRGYRNYAKWFPSTTEEIGCWSGQFGIREDVQFFTHWRYLPPAPAETREEK